MQWYMDVIKNYVGFSGRARRKEYWMFALINVIISIILSTLDSIIGTKTGGGIGVLNTIYSLAVLLPGLAVFWRRMHDTNRSGAWILLALIPIIGAIVLIVFAAQEGNPGDNKYGPDPKAAERGGAPFPGGEPGYPTV